MFVEEHLDLDVPGPVEVALEDQPLVAERRPSLAPGDRQGLAQVDRGAHDVHALAAAARARLDQDGIAGARCLTPEHRVRLAAAVIARQHGDADADGQPPRGGFVAKRPHGRRWGSDPDQPSGDDRLGEAGPLGEEAVPWMHGVRARGRGGGHDAGLIEVVALEFDDLVRGSGPPCVALVGGRQGKRLDAQGTARRGDAYDELASIGNEKPSDGPLLGCR